MKVKYIIGDDRTGRVWYGAYSPIRFSVPGKTNATPKYFDTPEEAMKEGEEIEKHFRDVLMVTTAVFIFRPEEEPAEKVERLKPLSTEPPPEAYTLQDQLTLVERERVMMKLTHQSLMMMIIYMN